MMVIHCMMSWQWAAGERTWNGAIGRATDETSYGTYQCARCFKLQLQTIGTMELWLDHAKE